MRRLVPLFWLTLAGAPDGMPAEAPPPKPIPSTLKLGRAFTDNAVLQRDRVCPVFGVDVPGVRITVTFAGQSLATRADAQGNWRVDLAALRVNPVPQTLTVAGTRNLTCTNLLVGDVWLIAGQSNADFPLRSATGGSAAVSSATNMLIRYLQMAESPRTDPVAWSLAEVARLTADAYFSGAWAVNDPASAGAVSAVGYFFARHLATNQNVPIGLVDCTVGGTPALSWMPTFAIDAKPRLKALAEHFLDSDRVAPWAKARLLQNLAEWNRAGGPEPMPEHPYKPGACWRNGLGTVAPFALRGLLWYQGETDADYPAPFDYELMARWHTETFQALVAAWRAAWERPDLPVYCVQLPQMNRASWPWFRESQLQCALTISNTALAVAYDCGDPDNVHPANKQPVADRLALIARAESYGENIEPSGPRLQSWDAQPGHMILRFDHATGGLVSADGRPLRLFEIAGTNRQFFPAVVSIASNALIVSAPEVPRPAAVRYAWRPAGEINFFNGAGLPASPFRTDRWKASHLPVRVACIGDSITYGHGINDTNQTYPAQLQALLGPGYQVRNFGKSGTTVTRDSVSGWARGYLRQPEHTNALAFQPDVMICNLGINDVSTFADSERPTLARDYREIISAYRALPATPRFIVWCPVAPLFPGQTYYGQPVVSNVNELIRLAANLSGADTIDLCAPLSGHPEWFPDKLHPNGQGARRIAEVICRFLRRTFEAPAIMDPSIL